MAEKLILPADIVDGMVARYAEGIPCAKIGTEFGYGANRVRHELKLHGVEMRRYKRVHFFNERFFESITTESQAYWLGFITGDGGIFRNCLAIGLQRRDRRHVERFADDIGLDWRGTKAVADINSVKPSARVYVTSRKIIADLERLGIGERKSLTVEPWNGPANLMPHYWRGMIDADGTIHRGNDGKWCVSLVGNRSTVTAFADYAHSVCGTSAKASPSRSIWRVIISGTPNARTLAKALYGSATVALERKLEKANLLIATRTGVEKFTLNADGNGMYTTTCVDCGKERKHKGYPLKSAVRCVGCARKADGKKRRGLYVARYEDGAFWSPQPFVTEDIDLPTLAKEYQDGASLRQLGIKYKCSRTAILLRLKLIGVEPRDRIEAVKLGRTKHTK